VKHILAFNTCSISLNKETRFVLCKEANRAFFYLFF